jgi:hypothetical protein
MQFGRAYNKAVRNNDEYFTFEKNLLYTKYAYYLCLNLVNEGMIKGKIDKDLIVFC